MEALGKIPDQFPKWPPNLGEFKSLCIIRPQHRMALPRLEFLDGERQMSPAAAKARRVVLNLVHAKTITPDDSA